MFALGNFLLFKYLGFVYYMNMDLNLHSLKYLLSMFVLLTRYVRLDKQQKCIPRSSRGYQIFWSPHWGLCQLAPRSKAQVHLQQHTVRSRSEHAFWRNRIESTSNFVLPTSLLWLSQFPPAPQGQGPASTPYCCANKDLPQLLMVYSEFNIQSVQSLSPAHRCPCFFLFFRMNFRINLSVQKEKNMFLGFHFNCIKFT